MCVYITFDMIHMALDRGGYLLISIDNGASLVYLLCLHRNLRSTLRYAWY